MISHSFRLTCHRSSSALDCPHTPRFRYQTKTPHRRDHTGVAPLQHGPNQTKGTVSAVQKGTREPGGAQRWAHTWQCRCV
eukprot:1165557-Rhodomonas_salina.2